MTSFLMQLSLVVQLVGLSSVQGNSVICKCNADIIEKIKEYWNSNGGPPKEVTTHTDKMQFTMGTESEFAKTGKCKSFKFTGDGRLYDIDKKTYGNISESCGRITFPDSDSYVIHYNNNVYCRYRCTKDGPDVSSTNLPEIAIAVGATPKDEDINICKTAVKNMGYEIKPYNCTP